MDLYRDLMDELECPVCYEQMMPPINQCVNGHSICSVCRARIVICPTCKGNMSDMRNFGLEKMSLKMVLSCCYAEEGCTVKLQMEDKLDHELQCPFLTAPICCQVENCTWQGKLSNLEQHWNSKVDMMSVLDVTNIWRVQLKKSYVFINLIRSDDKLFWFKIRNGESSISWIVQSVDSNPQDYFYEINIFSKRKPNKRMILGEYCSNLVSGYEDSCFEAGFNLPKTMLEAYSDFGSISYQITVTNKAENLKKRPAYAIKGKGRQERGNVMANVQKRNFKAAPNTWGRGGRNRNNTREHNIPSLFSTNIDLPSIRSNAALSESVTPSFRSNTAVSESVTPLFSSHNAVVSENVVPSLRSSAAVSTNVASSTSNAAVSANVPSSRSNAAVSESLAPSFRSNAAVATNVVSSRNSVVSAVPSAPLEEFTVITERDLQIPGVFPHSSQTAVNGIDVFKRTVINHANQHIANKLQPTPPPVPPRVLTNTNIARSPPYVAYYQASSNTRPTNQQARAIHQPTVSNPPRPPPLNSVYPNLSRHMNQNKNKSKDSDCVIS